MNDFDRRWQTLVAAARQAPARHAPLSDLHAARLAAQGLAQSRRQREAEMAWRGMALAAGLFLACLIGLGAAATVFLPSSAMSRTTLAMTRSPLPGTAFIPAPPRLPALASTAGAWSPVRVFSAVGAWLDPRPSASENTP